MQKKNNTEKGVQAPASWIDVYRQTWNKQNSWKNISFRERRLAYNKNKGTAVPLLSPSPAPFKRTACQRVQGSFTFLLIDLIPQTHEPRVCQTQFVLEVNIPEYDFCGSFLKKKTTHQWNKQTKKNTNILTITSWLLVWVVLWFGGNNGCKLLWRLLGGHWDAGSPKGMSGLHPCCNVTNRLVGTLGRQPGRVGHGSNLRGKQEPHGH